MKMLRVIENIELFGVTRPEDLDRAGIKHQYLTDGCYRNVHELSGLGAVIKFPKCRDNSEWMKSLLHARKEILAFAKIRKSQHWLREYLPETYYEDLKSGVIVMKKYQPRPRYKNKTLTRGLQKFFDTVAGNQDFDGHNLGCDLITKKVVIIDLGLY